MTTVTTFLMFQGDARPAITLYSDCFPDAIVHDLVLRGADGPGEEGTVERAELEFGGLRLMVFDSPTPHAFTFTPATSLFVSCESEQEQASLFERLGKGGGVLMPLDDYGFSQRFGWVSDRFGVSWQLDLPT